jgi:hypothetical protein
MENTRGEIKWVQLSNIPYARTPTLQNADTKYDFLRCCTTHWTPRTRPPPCGVLDHTNPKCFFRSFTNQRKSWKNSKIKKVLERIRAHQRLRLPTNWGWRDDGITTETDGFKREQERNALQNEKSRRRRGGYHHHWNLSGKKTFHCTQRLYSVLAVSLLNYDPMQHSSVQGKF